MRYVCLLTTVLLLLVISPAPTSAADGFHAELSCESNCSQYSGMTMDLTDLSRNLVGSAAIASDGSCDIRNVQPGTYRVTIKGPSGQIVHEDVVTVGAFNAPVRIRMPERKVERPVAGTISVQRLQHRVPKAAKKEYEKAEKAMKDGKLEESVQRLEEAVRLDPEYIEAHNNLGARYMRLNRNDKALASFRKALELDPSATMIQLNLSAALLAAGDAKAAELAIRRSLEQSNNAKGRYLLGLALYQQQQFTDEAIELLDGCQEQFPSARLALAVVQANRGNRDLARRTLRSYLADEQLPNRQQAMTMLNKLQ